MGFMFKRLARALKPALPEYVTLPLERRGSFSDGYMFAVAKWNLLWESAQFRRRYFDEDELPPEVGEIADRGDVNVAFVQGQRRDTTSTRRCITCCHGHRHSGTVCRLSVPGSGRTWAVTAIRTGTCRLTSVPVCRGRGHQPFGGISAPDRP